MNARFALRYLKYLFTARHKGGHGIHSPFLFQLLTKVIEDDSTYYAFRKIDGMRRKLLQEKTKINVSDYGAGSRILKSGERKIADIATYSSRDKKYGELLFRLTQHFKPKTILELGTCFGIGTSYMALAYSKSKVVTVEACPETAAVASEVFSSLRIKNIELKNKIFAEALPEILKKEPLLDFVVFDGNHRFKPTMEYFNQCKKNISDKTVFWFDDIHWSEEMELAWDEIKKDETVIQTVDLFHIGLVFFNKNLSKEDFVIRF